MWDDSSEKPEGIFLIIMKGSFTKSWEHFTHDLERIYQECWDESYKNLERIFRTLFIPGAIWNISIEVNLFLYNIKKRNIAQKKSPTQTRNDPISSLSICSHNLLIPDTNRQLIALNVVVIQPLTTWAGGRSGTRKAPAHELFDFQLSIEFT